MGTFFTIPDRRAPSFFYLHFDEKICHRGSPRHGTVMSGIGYGVVRYEQQLH